MSYDRYEGRRGGRDTRSRFYGEDRSRLDRDRFDRDRFDRDDPNERGFFERAGDEVASWFGDEDAEKRRRLDHQDHERGSFSHDDDYTPYDRQARFRDEGYRRPYTGRFTSRPNYGDRFGPERTSGQERWDRGRPQRDFTGSATGISDPHYGEWRRRQLDELDRDYDDYRRENQSKFEDDFSSWRSNRQTKRQMVGQVREHMQVVGSDEQEVGTVDKVRGDRIILTKNDSEDGRHHSLNCFLVDRIEGDRVILSKPAEEAKRQFGDDIRDRALFERDDRQDAGPHMLNRSFSGTY
jgi:hypothetical protein